MNRCAIFVFWDRSRAVALMEDRPDLGGGARPYWVYPGGKVEAEETPVAALLREALEEVGCQPTRWMPLPGTFRSPSAEGWDIRPFVVTDWLGRVPTSTLDWRRSSLAWRDPRAHMGEPDGFTANREIANAVYAQLIERAARRGIG